MNPYFDHNATTPLHPAAREAWLRAAERHWQNPSSLYREAGIAAQQLERARERLGELLHVEPGRILFTSGATEANNLLFAAYSGQKTAISAVEHPSVREAARHYTSCTELPVDDQGLVLLEALPDCKLLSIQAANNESGLLQPWQQAAALCRERGIRFHTDAVQWIGKLDVSQLGDCDYITGSAHKFGGPKGCGFLVVRDEDEPIRLLRGGPQENNRRAGTENYPAIEAMVTALENTSPQSPALRDAFISSLQQSFPSLRLISEAAPRLWNTVMVVMPAHENLKWLARLSRRGFSISTGSACSSGREGSSVVVSALGASPEELRRVLRFSSGPDTTAADWSALLAAMQEVFHELEAGGKGSQVVLTQ